MPVSVNYYERHIGDYLKDTAHLSLLEHGVYTRLLDVYYTRECGLPHGEVARLIQARSKDERAALDAVLAEFFVLADGLHTQERCEREVARYKEKSEKAARSANARWNHGRTHNERNANAMRTQCDGNAVAMLPVTSNQTPVTKEKKKKRASAQIPLPDGFGVSPRVSAWAAEKGHGRLPERLEHFVGYAKRNGKTYVDWDEAFMGAIREDWAKLNGRPFAAPSTPDAPALSPGQWQ